MMFSIITVTYNCIDTIEKTIKSVLTQKNVEFEYIIIDGCSNDGTNEIIKKYSNSFSYYISEKDDGIYDAMNKGINHAKGDVIAFLNSGDVYVENALSVVNKAFKKENHDIVCGRVKKIYKGEDLGFVGIGESYNPEDLHMGNIYCHQGLFIKKELFHSVGLYDTRYKTLADYNWNLQAYNKGYVFQTIPDVVAYYEDGGFSTLSITSPLEYYEISLRNLNGKEEYRERIENDYKVRKENKGLELLIKEKKLIDIFIPQNVDIYIYGAGYNGELCFKLFSACGYKIAGYIDTNPKVNIKDKLPVYSYDEFVNQDDSKTAYLLITPRFYDIEIKKKVINSGLKEDNIVMFSELLVRAAGYYINYVKRDKKLKTYLYEENR